MNQIVATVTNIKESGDLCHLFLESDLGQLGLVMLSNTHQIGEEIVVGFKESAVAISLDANTALSYANQISVEIESIEDGEILTKVVGVKGDTKLTSVITASSATKLNLKRGDKVMFLVKATDAFVV